MIKAEDLYLKNDYWCDYQPILNSFGQIVLQVDDNDYQGDSRVLYKRGNKYGLLVFGWGSCSGCDSLQACDSLDEIDELIKYLYCSIIWKDSAKEMLEFFKNREWKNLHIWYDDGETKTFIRRAMRRLRRDIKNGL